MVDCLQKKKKDSIFLPVSVPLGNTTWYPLQSRHRELELPWWSVTKTSPSGAGGLGSIPGWGAGIPHSSQPKGKNITVMNSVKALKIVVV